MNVRSVSAGSPLSHCEVTFTGLHSPPRGHEVNNPLWKHRPDNNMVAVESFISSWSGWHAAHSWLQGDETEMRSENVRKGGFFVNSGAH